MIKVNVYHNNVEQALRNMKRKSQLEQRLRKAKKTCHETPSEERRRKKDESMRRRFKLELRRARSEE